MASSIVGLTPTQSQSTEPKVPASQTGSQDVNKDMFLQLLVTQIRNQNPMSPMDGVQFLTQLAQFTEVEKLAKVQEDVAGIRDLLSPTTGAASSPVKDEVSGGSQ